ncbi:MAG: hypothetical protein M1820_009931 [Bogoriella megaspora]|nr:MAG: hypothetical protein M1820_009931 [Bogoriella megaspora]
MSTLDPAVAATLDNHRPSTTIEEDEDALIASLEEDDSIQSFREQRLQQLHGELSRAKAKRESGGGSYTEIKEEKGLMDITTDTKLCVVHFFKPDFGRCGVMDRNLEALAPKHFDTRFLRINVDNAPFLVTKLKVQVLPCVIAFVDGMGVDRIVGFEGLGYGDSFTLQDLESRLLKSGVLVRTKMSKEDGLSYRGSLQGKREMDDDSEDDDWD